MNKGKFVVLSLIAAALLSWQMMPTGVDTANSGIVNPCSSTASAAGGCYMICPQGDGDRLDDNGTVISVTVKDNTGAAIVNVPAADFWLIGCADALALCGGSGAINADGASDGSGSTTISGDLAGGGCDTGLQVVVQGVVIADPADWNNALCLAIPTRSPDFDGSLDVGIADFSVFAGAYPPNAYDACADFDCSTAVDIVDFSVFSQHYFHSC